MSSRLAAIAALCCLSGCTLLMQGTWEKVRFETRPPGAAFSVAGQTAVTPAELDIPKNEHVVVFRKPGYEDQQVELKLQTSSWFYGSIAMGVLSIMIDILSGGWKEFESSEVQVKLHPKAGTVEEIPITVDSDPPGAEILVGGAVHGRTPAEIWLTWADAQPQVDVTLRREGYRAKATSVPRGQSSLRVALEPEPVAIRVQVFSVPEGADVIVEGILEGRTPLTVTQYWVPSSPPKSVELKREGYVPVKLDLTRDQTRLDARLVEIEEDLPLTLAVFPPGAAVHVDEGPPVAIAGGLTLRWSASRTKHRIRAAHPGYATGSLELGREAAARPVDLRLAPMLPRLP